jgi:organic radical activating enzyme
MINRIRSIFDRLFPVAKPLPAGTYQYQSPADAVKPVRLHLRLEQDGSGLLLMNASTVLHLNQTAAEYAYHLIQQTPEDEMQRQVVRRYRVPAEQALQDFQDFKGRIDTLIYSPDLDPDIFLDIERTDPHTRSLSAPLRLDCALTYRTNTEISVAPVERVRRELLTEEWYAILEKAWKAGIPHIVFTGGEPTLRPDLPDLIQYAEKLGQITGLLTDGTRLSEKNYVHHLLSSGLDHLMIVLSDGVEETWEGIRDVLSEDIFTAIHLTLTPRNADKAPELITFLAKLGANAISISAVSPQLKDALERARQAASQNSLPLVYDLPVPYSAVNPLALELSADRPLTSGAGKAWLYVEPDADVLPGQGIPTVLGNFLSDPWEAIWEKAKAGQ